MSSDDLVSVDWVVEKERNNLGAADRGGLGRRRPRESVIAAPS